ncbi:hypothetical protein, partial [Limnobacter sp.]|uniref:hypothetical protein n=1 Tax=Limnobacter sp. TaxID=2003368 RepID=UPI0027337D0A
NYAEVSYLLERQLSQAYGTNTRLTINGNAGDTVTLEGPWAVVGTSTTHTTYALDGLYVSIDTDVTRNVESWTIPYQGATMDLFGLPTGFRTSTVSSGLSLDGDGFGNYLVNIGDVNNDGFADFAVRQDEVSTTGLRRYDRWESNYDYWSNGVYTRNWTVNIVQRSDTVRSGEVYVIYGKAGGLDAINLATANAGFLKLTGSASANENLGAYMNSLGDINGDGISDMMIGATRSSRTFTFNEGGEKSYFEPNGATDVTAVIGTYTVQGNLNQQSPDWNSDSWSQSLEGRQYIFLGNNGNLVDRTGGAITSTTVSNNFNDGTTLPTTYDTTGAPNTDL